MGSFNPEAEMNHFSLEVLGKERQQNLVEEQLREQRVREGRPAARLSPRRLIATAATILLMYLWLFG